MTEQKTDRSSAPRVDIMDALDRIRESLSDDALRLVCERFGLSAFERDTLLFCAGAEMQPDIAQLLATLHGSPAMRYPTFGLLLGTHPDAHWSAVTPDAPLRYWRMIHIDSAVAMLHGRMRIDERMLHALLGMDHIDERLQPYVRIMPPRDIDGDAQTADRIFAVWLQQVQERRNTVVEICGGDLVVRTATAQAVAGRLGRQLRSLETADLPADGRELAELARLCDREFLLSGAVLSVIHNEEAMLARAQTSVGQFLRLLRAPALLITRDRLPIDGVETLSFEITPPGRTLQRELWSRYLKGTAVPENEIERIVAQYNLQESAIRHISRTFRALHEAAAHASVEQADPALMEWDAVKPDLWDVCRRQLRPKLDALAQRIEPVARWDDLVLPEEQMQTLAEIALHVRRRIRVYEEWGFASRGRRGLGISALFSGESGTGKTMAAEVIAGELALDLYRIDLSQVVNKYIGETEKNLRRLFDEAEGSGAILFFDEADALFGKRSEVRDSHDRYANMEISYLLQRMEDFSGLAILATNRREALDEAFLRRLRFVVSFPFPDTQQRAEIWSRIFPGDTPKNGLDTHKLAQLRLAGGNIRNIALYAAFLAADENTPVGMRHILTATRRETAKMQRPLSSSEIQGW